MFCTIYGGPSEKFHPLKCFVKPGDRRTPPLGKHMTTDTLTSKHIITQSQKKMLHQILRGQNNQAQGG